MTSIETTLAALAAARGVMGEPIELDYLARARNQLAIAELEVAAAKRMLVAREREIERLRLLKESENGNGK